VDAIRIERRRQSRGEVGGHEHAVAVRHGRSLPGERMPREFGKDRVADGPDVGGPAAQVRVGQRGEITLDRAYRVRPGRGGGYPGVNLLVDPAQQVGVVEQHQVRVEDLRLGLAELPGGDGAQPLDLSARGGHRFAQPSPLRGRLRRSLRRAARGAAGGGTRRGT
jgi:hypothetical protein